MLQLFALGSRSSRSSPGSNCGPLYFSPRTTDLHLWAMSAWTSLERKASDDVPGGQGLQTFAEAPGTLGKRAIRLLLWPSISET